PTKRSVQSMAVGGNVWHRSDDDPAHTPLSKPIAEFHPPTSLSCRGEEGSITQRLDRIYPAGGGKSQTRIQRLARLTPFGTCETAYGLPRRGALAGARPARTVRGDTVSWCAAMRSRGAHAG